MLYAQLLKADFERLPGALRDFHSRPGGGRASGIVNVRHNSRWLAWLAGFPPAGENIPVELEVTLRENEEVWTRRFGGSVRRSVQRRHRDLLLETVGPIRVLFRVLADDSGMRFECRGVRFWIIPLPVRVEGKASGDDSSWEFEVTVGSVGSYRGAMVPAP